MGILEIGRATKIAIRSAWVLCMESPPWFLFGCYVGLIELVQYYVLHRTDPCQRTTVAFMSGFLSFQAILLVFGMTCSLGLFCAALGIDSQRRLGRLSLALHATFRSFIGGIIMFLFGMAFIALPSSFFRGNEHGLQFAALALLLAIMLPFLLWLSHLVVRGPGAPLSMRMRALLLLFAGVALLSPVLMPTEPNSDSCKSVSAPSSEGKGTP